MQQLRAAVHGCRSLHASEVPSQQHHQASGGSSPASPLSREPPPPQYKPWTFTRFLNNRGSAYPRRMRFLIETLEKERRDEIQMARGVGMVDSRSFKSGDILEVRMAVPEDGGKQRVYKGVCISRHKGHGLRAAFKLYNVYTDAGPVIQHLPLFMPDLKEVKVVGKMNAGTQRKKYHLTNDESISFQKQVGTHREPSEMVAAGNAQPHKASEMGKAEGNKGDQKKSNKKSK